MENISKSDRCNEVKESVCMDQSSHSDLSHNHMAAEQLSKDIQESLSIQEHASHECTSNNSVISGKDQSENDNHKTQLETPECAILTNDDSDSESNYESAEEDQRDEDFVFPNEDNGSDKEELEIIQDEKEDEKEEELEEILTEEVKIERRKEAQTQKEEGNALFKEQKYEEAITCYSNALKCCPKDYVKDRSIMFSNRAACKLKLDLTEEAIKDCTEALDLHPHYLKALLRRAELYEKVEKLDEALVDYQKVVEMDPSQHSARAACMRLPDQIKERNEKMKEEMIGKLKDLGNMILKPFGLSTNNFQMTQDPNTGGYSVNFKQNA